MADFTAADSAFMARALRLAERGRYTAHPNPMVGCVLVREGTVVGEGWHERAGAARRHGTRAR
jgi:diaminohydroxyphosphoribosylaminopyrimidine deaminase/5-amino-6-(5-phosphoribosylamino)uracil reductase